MRIQPGYSKDTVRIQQGYSQGTAGVQSGYSRGTSRGYSGGGWKHKDNAKTSICVLFLL